MSEDNMVPNVDEISGRFKACTEFVAGNYGGGYWNVTVEDTLTGERDSAVVYEMRDAKATAQMIAKRLDKRRVTVDGSQGEGWTFNLENETTEANDSAAEEVGESD